MTFLSCWAMVSCEAKKGWHIWLNTWRVGDYLLLTWNFAIRNCGPGIMALMVPTWLLAVSQKLNADKVIYMGFSAGGLAAMVAANLDKHTQAFFGLDMVDNRGLGKKLAPNMTVPLYGLIAAPSACNANNNGLDLYALAPQSNVIKVEDTSHCHFEFPVDGKCSFVCGKGEKRFSRQTIQQTIVGLTTSFLLWRTGIDANGETWWHDSKQNYKTLIDAGYIKKPINDETGFN